MKVCLQLKTYEPSLLSTKHSSFAYALTSSCRLVDGPEDLISVSSGARVLVAEDHPNVSGRRV